MEVIKIDATGKKIGRLSTEIADLLNGKTSPKYAPNVVPDIKVEVENASRLDILDKKRKSKIYQRYTGFFGGLKERTMEQVIVKKGYEEIIRHSVRGMLPSNRLRAVKLKRLTVKD